MKTRAEKLVSNLVPNINVTPLIDVLLVLLIIFMVASPLKPSRFNVQLPQPPPPATERIAPNPWTLIVTIDNDLRLKLNGRSDMGSVNDTTKLSAELAKVFEKRIENHAYKFGMETRVDFSPGDRIERTVFIKAPRAIHYGEVAKVIDGVKGAGASPVGLQLDGLD